MPKKDNLLKAQKEADGEFYTDYNDISRELSNYGKEVFADKKIICPCDWDLLKEVNCKVLHIDFSGKNYQNPIITITREDNKKRQLTNKDWESGIFGGAVRCNFVKFLASQAETYQIKSITASGYNPITNEGIDALTLDYSPYDIVVTNPPFNRFREFVDVWCNAKIDFVVIGPYAALTYKDIFKRIKSKELFLGRIRHESITFYDEKWKPKRAVGINWYTSMDMQFPDKSNDLWLPKYSLDELKNQSLDTWMIDTNGNNSGILRVAKYTHIPYDYDGIMAVPITFFDYWNPECWDIINMGSPECKKSLGLFNVTKNNNKVKNVILPSSGNSCYYFDHDGIPKTGFTSIFVKYRFAGMLGDKVRQLPIYKNIRREY